MKLVSVRKQVDDFADFDCYKKVRIYTNTKIFREINITNVIITRITDYIEAEMYEKIKKSS